MRINKKQSRLIAFAAMVIFFLVGISFLNNSSNQKKLMIKSVSQEQTEDPTSTEKASLDPDIESDINPEPEVSGTEKQSSAAIELQNFERSEIKDGKKVWEIKARRSIYNPKKQTTQIFDALLIVYREIDQVIKVKATRADLLLEKGNPAIVDFYDGVELDTGDGMKLNTSTARYNTKEATIDAEDEVIIKDKLFEVTGGGFHADLNKQIFEFKKHKMTTINKGAK